MTNEEMERAFAALVDGVEIDANPIVHDVSKLSDRELGALMYRTRKELYAREEMEHPATERARELHGLRAAIVVETNRRAYSREVEPG